MTIVFICGGLQPGRDGVGDYVIKLAAQLKLNGHAAAAVAIFDSYVSNETSELQCSEEMAVEVLRLPSIWPHSRRLAAAKQWIDNINPDWLSLQYVPFAFHNKGLPVLLNTFLSRLGKRRKWHIMFHELWVGMPMGTSKTHMFWGWIQKQIIKLLISRLQPEVIHTQCMLYYLQLNKMGSNVSHLPLFSNIPVAHPDALSTKLEVSSIAESQIWNNKRNYPYVQNSLEKYQKNSVLEVNERIDTIRSISLIIFGTIHPETSINIFIDLVNAFKTLYPAKFSLTLVGNCGSEQNLWVSTFEHAGIEVKAFGPQSPTTISFLLQNATIGISTTAACMSDKSGTVAAMLEHKLPVICVGQGWQPRKLKMPGLPGGMYALTPGCLEACLNTQQPLAEPSNVTTVAKLFIESLTKSPVK